MASQESPSQRNASEVLEDATFRDRSVGHQVNHVARLFERSLRVRIEAFGVVPGQFAQLLALYEEDGLTQTELCERVRIDPSTMAHTLKRMERDDLVRRERDPDDRRYSRVVLTPHARRLAAVLLDKAREVNALALAGFADGESERALAVLDQLKRNLEADPCLGRNAGATSVTSA